MAKFQKKDPEKGPDVTEEVAVTATLAEVFARLLLKVAEDELPLDRAEAEFREVLVNMSADDRERQVAELNFNYGRLHNALPHLLATFKRAWVAFSKQL